MQLEQYKMKSFFIFHLLYSVAFKNEFNYTFGRMMNIQWLEAKRVVNSSKMLKIENVNDSNINKLK